MDAYTALVLTQMRAAELQADARRHALVKSFTGRRTARRTATTRTAAARTAAACAGCAA